MKYLNEIVGSLIDPQSSARWLFLRFWHSTDGKKRRVEAMTLSLKMEDKSLETLPKWAFIRFSISLSDLSPLGAWVTQSRLKKFLID